ncbi:DUF2384 domain-containing protein [Hyphobacterium sp. CCMP332]|nr:DUF2384 domain-containing protein [Hyphobacterium sp. CCMP332]
MNITSKSNTSHYRKLKTVLGSNYVNERIDSSYDFIHLANAGIKAGIIKNFKNYFNISREETANMLNISSPTLYRWIRSDKVLDRNSSVQLFELTDLFLYGSEVFLSKEDFIKWLNLPNQAFGGMEPIELLEIPGGISKVKDLLGRIEHGIIS